MELEQNNSLLVSELEKNNRIIVSMAQRDGGIVYSSRNPKTVFDIIAEGEEPYVELLQTAEGKTLGDAVYFVGSVASKAHLYEPEKINKGLIVPEQRLVVRKPNKELFALPGVIVDVETKRKLRRN